MTGAPEPTFVDTNVLAYAYDASERARQPTAAALLDELWQNARWRIAGVVIDNPFARQRHRSRRGANRSMQSDSPERRLQGVCRTGRPGWAASTSPSRGLRE